MDVNVVNQQRVLRMKIKSITCSSSYLEVFKNKSLKNKRGGELQNDRYKLGVR